MVGFNHKKSIQCLVFFAEKEGGIIDKMKAFKLIWLADKLHLLQYGRPILNDTYFAMKLGPVPSNTKDLVDSSDFLSEAEREVRDEFILTEDKNRFRVIKKLQPSVFSKTDMDTMTKIYDMFGSLNPYNLSELSHNYPEWKKFEASLESGYSSRFEMDYNDFFEDPRLEIDKLFSCVSEELLQLNSGIYRENKILQNLV